MNLATIDNLRVSFAGQYVLDGVSVDVKAQGITMLLGKSGAGKTTFLRALNRLNECFPDCQTQGEVHLWRNGVAIPLYSPSSYGSSAPFSSLHELRQRVGMVFQTPNILPMSVLQNICLPLQTLKKVTKSDAYKRAQTALETTELWREVKDRLHIPAESLSGGQQQRLCLSRAIALEPDVLLLDEPTASLDPATTEAIEQLILTLSSRYNIVMVSHTLAQARRLGSHFILLSQNQTVSTLTAEEAMCQGRLEGFFKEA